MVAIDAFTDTSKGGAHKDDNSPSSSTTIMEISRRPLTVYRIVKRYPPTIELDYSTSQKRFDTSSQPDSVRRASAGLSVFRSLESVLAQQMKYPMLGSIIVRYHVPVNAPVEIWHLVGSPDHWTAFCDPPDRLHAYLDPEWAHVTGRPPSERKD